MLAFYILSVCIFLNCFKEVVFPIGRSDGYPTDGGTSVLLSEILDSLFQAFVRNVGWMLPNLETSEEFELKYIEGVDSIRFLLLIELHWKKKKSVHSWNYFKSKIIFYILTVSWKWNVCRCIWI